MTTRGVRNNDPGNIRLSPTKWLGEVEGDDPAFEVFDTPEHGIRAIAKIMLSYRAAGVCTVAAIINRWAPPNENDTDAYTRDVCTRLLVVPTTLIDVTVIDVMLGVVAAIIRHENGYDPYDAATIRRGCLMALGG